jgi:murein DD-endopeptidase MepM/ murein hydrolase activator NlpD
MLEAEERAARLRAQELQAEETVRPRGRRAIDVDARIAVAPASGRRAGSVSADDAAPRSAAGRRAAEAAKSAEAARTVDPPKRAKDATGGGAGEAAIPPRRRRARGDITKKAFGGLAFLFVAGIAVATSVPAEAYFAATPGAVVEQLADGPSSSLPHQQLATDGESVASTVTRDAYTITSIPTPPVVEAASTSVTGSFTTAAASGTIQWPLPVGAPISDGFGARESPGGIGSTYHLGVDFAPGLGTPIQIVADGVVRLTNNVDDSGLGCYVIVDHNVGGEAFSSVYGHMQCASIAVEEGQAVKVTQLVGLVGNTGTSTGPHLHFEIHDESDTPIDPLPWMNAHVS